MSRSFERSSVCPSAFPSSVATTCLTRSALLDAMIANPPCLTTCCATANPIPDDPPSTTIRFPESSPSSPTRCFCIIAISFLCGSHHSHTPLDSSHSTYAQCIMLISYMRLEKLQQRDGIVIVPTPLSPEQNLYAVDHQDPCSGEAPPGHDQQRR